MTKEIIFRTLFFVAGWVFHFFSIRPKLKEIQKQAEELKELIENERSKLN